MLILSPEVDLEPQERLVLAVDTTDVWQAHQYAKVAKSAGAKIIKLGLEHESLDGPRPCSELAEDNGLEWIADFKTYATSKTIAPVITRYTSLAHPPIGITISLHSGEQSLRIAQEIAGQKNIAIFGVGHLSVIDNIETEMYEGMGAHSYFMMQIERAVNTGIQGMVCSGLEVADVASAGLVSLVVATRSRGVEIVGDDQKRVTTPAEARLSGATLIEVGRQVIEAENPVGEMRRIREEIA
ncbi:MAG TPA: orotidine 5'-phosphate decarboxylase / HUMPS family protein [Candidatus Saccharimonadales bacterium]|nr:orotidine 5'-phosphate decarboxylase / HUMPS family protein [Candidatus Saccharimonadales bacterium]